MRYAYIVELHVTDSNIKHGVLHNNAFVSPATIKYSDLRVKWPIFLPDFDQIRIFSIDFHKSAQYQI